VNYFFWEEYEHSTRVNSAWFSYKFLVCFLVVFRTQQAYSHYWEGVTLLHKTKGDWLNAFSCIIAFCSTDPKKAHEVAAFQHLVVRLMSLLHCSALQQVTMLDNEAFDVIDLVGVELEKIEHLAYNSDTKCLILLQWIQRLIIQATGPDNLIPAAPPIVSRIFQQLSNGYTNLIDAQKITDIPFPFPYAQLVSSMLLLNTVLTPWICGNGMESRWWAAGLTFAEVFGFWSINYIAVEIEMPFGDDHNDLPIPELQAEMNRDLKVLLHQDAQHVPTFDFDAEIHEEMNEMQCCDGLVANLRDSELDLASTGKRFAWGTKGAHGFSHLTKDAVQARKSVAFGPMGSASRSCGDYGARSGKPLDFKFGASLSLASANNVIGAPERPEEKQRSDRQVKIADVIGTPELPAQTQNVIEIAPPPKLVEKEFVEKEVFDRMGLRIEAHLVRMAENLERLSLAAAGLKLAPRGEGGALFPLDTGRTTLGTSSLGTGALWECSADQPPRELPSVALSSSGIPRAYDPRAEIPVIAFGDERLKVGLRRSGFACNGC